MFFKSYLIKQGTIQKAPLVALATRCQNKEWQPVRETQQEIIISNKNTFICLRIVIKFTSKKFRHDFCHFSNLGAQKLGDIYYESIKNFFLILIKTF